MITLDPQETLLIRAGGSLTPTWRWHEAGLDTDVVSAKVIVGEEFIEDERYAIKNWSEKAVSRNKASFTWARSDQ